MQHVSGLQNLKSMEISRAKSNTRRQHHELSQLDPECYYSVSSQLTSLVPTGFNVEHIYTDRKTYKHMQDNKI